MDDLAGWVVIARAPRRAPIDERALVLGAVGVPNRVEHQDGALLLLVPAELAARALGELSAYDRENAGARPRELVPPIPPGALPSAVFYATTLIAVHVLERGEAFGLPWWTRGAADAARIGAGEWWRAATALTLHTDLGHLAGNLVFGSIFGVLFAQLVGSGVAWSAAFASGCLGNLMNAWVQGPDHRSVGASTAVFGVLGCLVVYEWRRRTRFRARWVRRAAPPILGLVLLAWLGAGGERTDVGAHAWGMLWGGLLGGLIGAVLALRRGVLPWGPAVQVACGLATVAAIAGAWVLALG